VASSSLESSLLKYSCKEYFFRAALCHLCVDVLNAQHALERYQELCPAFQDSREYKLLKVRSVQYYKFQLLRTVFYNFVVKLRVLSDFSLYFPEVMNW